MHTLDIIVTHCNEPNETIERFLNSLRYQFYRDFKVTIIDDGFDCPKLNLDKKYGFEIQHLKKEHKTVSAARNFGMDNTSAPYLMFCDCDDMFYSSNRSGLHNAMWRIKRNDLCVYRSLIMGEVWKKNSNGILSALYKVDEDDTLELTHGREINNATVHCKIYKRSFLEENNIRFLDDLYMNEDGVFNALAYEICKHKNMRFLNDCEYFYIWKHNANSVTRTNRLYPIRGYDQFLVSSAYVLNKLKELGKDISSCAAEDLFQAYYWLHLYSDKFINEEGFEEAMNISMNKLKELLPFFIENIKENAFNEDGFLNYTKRYISKLDNTALLGKKKFEDWLKDIRSIQ